MFYDFFVIDLFSYVNWTQATALKCVSVQCADGPKALIIKSYSMNIVVNSVLQCNESQIRFMHK